jgi:hypothetical protein
MSGKTAGQLAYETYVSFVGLPLADWPWEADYVNRALWDAVAAAVETDQLRLAREDRDQLRKQVLDLAAELERLAGEHADKAAEYDRDAAQENFHRGCSAGLGNAAGRIRYAAGPPS